MDLTFHPSLLLFFSPYFSFTARQAASTSYKPIVICLNLLFIFLRFIYQWNTVTITQSLGAICLLALSYIAYKGVIEDHANNNINNSMMAKQGGKNKYSNTQAVALAGGASLDLLGLVIVIQYGSIFVSNKFYWLLVMIPIYAAYKMYTTFRP